jgi:hypothetical protein
MKLKRRVLAENTVRKIPFDCWSNTDYLFAAMTMSRLNRQLLLNDALLLGSAAVGF